MRICFIGDIVAAPGRRAMKRVLPNFLRDNNIDICIANAENSAHGLGVSPKVIEELTALGADAITLGNHTFSNYDYFNMANRYPQVARPANVSPDWPGFDYVIVEKNGNKLGVINLLGQVDIMPSAADPFRKADELIDALKAQGVNDVFIDFHAEATGEKIAFGYYMDGKAVVVAGTHTHVQTADNRILPNGTGYISDAGMTGCMDSVLGMDIDISIGRLKDKLNLRYQPAEGDAAISGIIADINNGKCISIKRFTEYE
ncbi:MAG: YmdB family metallophosphoesterase [Saccharofermentans sp.]|nr:YmdB family metallophosphoesterase [Saccharofermentans sp.]